MGSQWELTACSSNDKRPNTLIENTSRYFQLAPSAATYVQQTLLSAKCLYLWLKMVSLDDTSITDTPG